MAEPLRKCAWEKCPGRSTPMHEIETGEELHDECKAEILAAPEPTESDPAAWEEEMFGYPAPEPYVCSQEPHPGREFYGDGACAECGYTPKPPRLDPEPYRCKRSYCSVARHVSALDGTVFAPRGEYSQRREDYV
jgi:hypothetical protein